MMTIMTINGCDFPRVHIVLSRARLTIRGRGTNMHPIVIRTYGSAYRPRGDTADLFASFTRFRTCPNVSLVYTRHRYIHALSTDRARSIFVSAFLTVPHERRRKMFTIHQAAGTGANERPRTMTMIMI